MVACPSIWRELSSHSCGVRKTLEAGEPLEGLELLNWQNLKRRRHLKAAEVSLQCRYIPVQGSWPEKVGVANLGTEPPEESDGTLAQNELRVWFIVGALGIVPVCNPTADTMA